MTHGADAARRALMLAAVCGGGWLAALSVQGLHGREAAESNEEPRAAPSSADYDAATLSVAGALAPAARARIGAATGDGEALVVVLGPRDHLVCEDLGRQLRELRAHADSALPLVVAVDSESVEPVRAFLRRERVRAAAVLDLPATDVLAGAPRLPTPAALVTRSGFAHGVAHPRRFANVRVRSFADELDPLVRTRSAGAPADAHALPPHGGTP